MKSFQADMENNGEEFWDALRADRRVTEQPIQQWITNMSFDLLVLDDMVADRFLRICMEQPGWNDGPAYAPHPILVSDIRLSKSNVDLVQGCDERDRPFGYVAGIGGGFFFTWMSTLEATLASVEEDEQDGDGGLTESEVVDFLRDYLPNTGKGKSLWASN